MCMDIDIKITYILVYVRYMYSMRKESYIHVYIRAYVRYKIYVQYNICMKEKSHNSDPPLCTMPRSCRYATLSSSGLSSLAASSSLNRGLPVRYLLYNIYLGCIC